MANSPIRLLPAATEIMGIDLFVLEQGGVAKKLSGAKLTEFIDRQIMDVKVHDLSANSEPTAEYDRITGKLQIGIPKGNSIVSISLSKEDKVVFTWADGNKYTGEFLNDMRHGKGVYEWKNGDKYEGDFFENNITGYGTFTYSYGRTYTGEFKNGIMVYPD